MAASTSKLTSDAWLADVVDCIVRYQGGKAAGRLQPEAIPPEALEALVPQSGRLGEKVLEERLLAGAEALKALMVKKTPTSEFRHREADLDLIYNAMTGLVVSRALRRRECHLDGEKSARREREALLLRAFRVLLYASGQFQEQHVRDRRRLPSSVQNHGWDTPMLVQLVRLLVQTVTSSGRQTPLDEHAVGELNRQWRKLYVFLQTADADCEDQMSRRRGTLVVINGLLAVLYHEGNTVLTSKLIASVEHGERTAEKGDGLSILTASQRMRSEVGKYHFYKGRLHFASGAPITAFQAFQSCWRYIGGDPIEKNNQARLLFYWFATAVSLGLDIPEAVASVDSFVTGLFRPILDAIRVGDLKAFISNVEHHAVIFQRYGVYFTLLGARRLVYLYLLRRVYDVIATAAAEGAEGYDPSQVSLELVVSAVRHLSGTKDSSAEAASELFDSICLWLARLIGEGRIRGYVSYEHATIVLSKKDPFPSISGQLTAAM